MPIAIPVVSTFRCCTSTAAPSTQHPAPSSHCLWVWLSLCVNAIDWRVKPFYPKPKQPTSFSSNDKPKKSKDNDTYDIIIIIIIKAIIVAIKPLQNKTGMLIIEPVVPPMNQNSTDDQSKLTERGEKKPHHTHKGDVSRRITYDDSQVESTTIQTDTSTAVPTLPSTKPLGTSLSPSSFLLASSFSSPKQERVGQTKQGSAINRQEEYDEQERQLQEQGGGEEEVYGQQQDTGTEDLTAKVRRKSSIGMSSVTATLWEAFGAGIDSDNEDQDGGSHPRSVLDLRVASLEPIQTFKTSAKLPTPTPLSAKAHGIDAIVRTKVETTDQVIPQGRHQHPGVTGVARRDTTNPLGDLVLRPFLSEGNATDSTSPDLRGSNSTTLEQSSVSSLLKSAVSSDKMPPPARRHPLTPQPTTESLLESCPRNLLPTAPSPFVPTQDALPAPTELVANPQHSSTKVDIPSTDWASLTLPEQAPSKLTKPHLGVAIGEPMTKSLPGVTNSDAADVAIDDGAADDVDLADGNISFGSIGEPDSTVTEEESYMKDTPMPNTFTIGPYDVICGDRTKRTMDHVGNRRFHVIINMNQQRYSQTVKRNAKSMIVLSIVKSIRSSGGHFVKRNKKTGLWMEIGDQQAREKVGYALRDAINAESRKQLALKRKADRKRRQIAMMAMTTTTMTAAVAAAGTTTKEDVDTNEKDGTSMGQDLANEPEGQNWRFS